jgi:hypothetical protein
MTTMEAIPIDLTLDPNTVVALLTLCGVILSTFYARHAKTEASQANKAVNQRGPGEPTLYQLVLNMFAKVEQISKWKATYEGGPLDEGSKVRSFVEKVDSIEKTVKELKQDVKTYGCPVKLRDAEKCLQETDRDLGPKS